MSCPLHLAPCPLHLALVVFPFFQMVHPSHLHWWWLSPVAICTGGAFSSSHWCKHCTCTRATCIIYYLILLRKGGSLMPEPAEKPSLYYIIILYHHLKCTMRRTGVPIRWTGALDWTIYWTRVILCKSVNDVITNRPPSCVVRVASIGSLREWMFLLFPDPLTPNIYTSCLALTLHHLLTTSSFECCFT